MGARKPLNNGNLENGYLYFRMRDLEGKGKLDGNKF